MTITHSWGDRPLEFKTWLPELSEGQVKMVERMVLEAVIEELQGVFWNPYDDLLKTTEGECTVAERIADLHRQIKEKA